MATSSEPLSRVVPAADIPPGGKRVHVEAAQEERERLATLLGIPSVEKLAAELTLKPAADGAVIVAGMLDALVTQTDVVTLEPVSQAVAETIEVLLYPAEPPLRQGGRRAPVFPPDEEADTFSNGRLELGAVIREHLALGLDPYPRAPDTDFQPYVEDAPGAEPSPFAALAKVAAPKTS